MKLSTELQWYDNLITRVEVHFGDENGDKFGTNDKRDIIEVRTAKKKQPVTDYVDTIKKAFSSAINKIARVFDTTQEKMRNH